MADATEATPAEEVVATGAGGEAGAVAEAEPTKAERAQAKADAADRAEQLACRFYEQKYPKADECVMVNVKQIADMGAYVSLLEYNNIEGMIMYSELSRRRIRSINKLIRVGKNEVVMVTRVDPDRGYIDLSKRRVAAEDMEKCEERYNKSKTVHSILRHVAETEDVTLESLYESLGWPLYRDHGHAIAAFKKAVKDASIFDKYKLPENILKTLMVNIRRRLAPQALKVRADIQVRCFNYEGIDAVKAALLAGQALGTDDSPIKIKLIAPPLYVMSTTAMVSEDGIQILTAAIEATRKVIEEKGGNMSIKNAPRVTSARDETELAKLMEQLQLQNEEVDGDDDAQD